MGRVHRRARRSKVRFKPRGRIHSGLSKLRAHFSPVRQAPCTRVHCSLSDELQAEYVRQELTVSLLKTYTSRKRWEFTFSLSDELPEPDELLEGVLVSQGEDEDHGVRGEERDTHHGGELVTVGATSVLQQYQSKPSTYQNKSNIYFCTQVPISHLIQ